MAAQAPGDRVSWSSRARPEQADFTLAAGEQKAGLKLVVTRKRGTIRGVVLGPDGQPLAGASVQAAREREAGRAYKNDLDGGGRAVSGPDGAFALEELASGNFTVWAAHPGHPELEQNRVAAGTSTLRLQLLASASMAGNLVDGAGRRCGSTGWWWCRPRGPASRRAGACAGRWIPTGASPSTSTIARGAFLAGDLAPGAYDLVASAPGRADRPREPGSPSARGRRRPGFGWSCRGRWWSAARCWSTRAASRWPG